MSFSDHEFRLLDQQHGLMKDKLAINRQILNLFAKQLNRESQRKHALDKAREYYYLGHRQKEVKLLVLEARLANHLAVRCRKEIKDLQRQKEQLA